MVSLIKTLAKVAWFSVTYTIIFSYMFDIGPTIASIMPAVSTSQVVFGVLGSTVSVISWIVTPPVFKAACYVWLLLPFLKFPMYVGYKVNHL